MADEDKASKTEEPTQRKLDDAHKKGQVVKSQEVGNWAMIAASTLAVAIFAGPIMVNMAEGLRGFMENAHDIRVDPETLHMVLKTLAVDIVKLLAAPLGILLVAAIGSNMIQHRPVLTLEKLKPKFEKISPIKGLKEKFSLKTIAEFVKNIGKVAIAQNRRPDMKVIFISGHAQEVFESNLKLGLEYSFLLKPFSLKDLAGRVKEVLAP